MKCLQHCPVILADLSPVEVGNTGTGTQSLTSMRRDCHSDLVHMMGHVKMLRAHATRLTSRVKRPANAPMVANDVSAAATVHRGIRSAG